MKNDFSICDTPGPCWDGYIYVGPEVGKKGSCVKISKLCNKTRGNGIQCKNNIICNVEKTKDSIENKPNKNQKEEYEKCLEVATKRFNKGDLKLCPRGYCAAKQKFEVYPSAYANAHASSVCKGKSPGFLNQKMADEKYTGQLDNSKKNNLARWIKEEWVNVCEKGNGPGGFKKCGTGKGVKSPKNYPYCRAYHKLPETKVVTVTELKKYYPNDFADIIEKMCDKKRSLPQGVKGKPTRINLPKNIYDFIHKKRLEEQNEIKVGGSVATINIPQNVKDDAALGLKLHELGFEGGTTTGWNRARQLVFDEKIDVSSLANMRAWFSRHGPDASNDGTSYRGYCNWVQQGMPMDSEYKQHRGAVSWLIWGGDSAYSWLKDDDYVRALLEKHYPKGIISPKKKNLRSDCQR